MPKGMLSGDALCPFYRTDVCRQRGRYKYDIVCEGLIPRSGIMVRFEHRTDFDVHTKTFCCGLYKNCEIAIAITNAGYAEEDEG